MNSTMAVSLGGEAQSFPERGDRPNDLFRTSQSSGDSCSLSSSVLCAQGPRVHSPKKM